MTRHQQRFDAAAAGLHGRREGLVGGGSLPLVTLRLHDAPGARPDAVCDPRPSEARTLAERLLACARHADALPETR